MVKINTLLCLNNVFITGNEIGSTTTRSAVTVNEDPNQTDNLEKRSTSTILKITDMNIGTILERRIQTNWQFMLIITCVLIVLATTYLGKCVHRHLKSRAHQVSNTDTAAPNTTINESNQIEYFYEDMQNAEYEEPERYRTVVCDDNSENGINTFQEKMESVSIMNITSSLEPSTDEAFNGHHVSESIMYENQPKIEIRETGDLYLTPTI